jgi:uncharacterized protein
MTFTLLTMGVNLILIQVDSIDAKVRSIEEAGGFIVDPPLDLPGGSRLCLFNEPSGVTLAMIRAAQGAA